MRISTEYSQRIRQICAGQVELGDRDDLEWDGIQIIQQGRAEGRTIRSTQLQISNGSPDQTHLWIVGGAEIAVMLEPVGHRQIELLGHRQAVAASNQGYPQLDKSCSHITVRI